MRVKTPPLRLPDLIGQSDMTRWPMCYQPEVPMLVLKGVRGYSLNLANAITFLVAYLIGMVFLVMLARVGH